MYRCGIIFKDGKQLANNFKTKDECEYWILELMDKKELKRSVIVNKDNISERYIENF